MTRFHTPTVSMRGLLIAPLALTTFDRATADDSLAGIAPQGAVAVVTLRDGAGRVEAFRDGAFWRRAIESDAASVVREAPQFQDFVATMTTLIGGLDFSDQFLPQLMPDLQFLSANHGFDKDKSPSPVVFRLKDAEKFGPRLDSASLMGLTFLNAAAAEQKGPQLLIQADQYNGHKITYGRYAMNESAAATQAAKADIRYNFSPAMARVDDHVIVSSTYEFARDIMDVLAKPSQTAGTKARDEWYVYADELFRILHSNRETFVAQQMLEKDLEKAQAERMIDALLGTARWFKDVRITSELLPDGAKATLRIGLADAAR